MSKARDRLEAALARIDDPKGEGARACLTVYREAAKAAADAADARARAGISLGPLDGAIVTVKDLFDIAGEVTRAGSKVLAEEGKPATRDAPVVRRLRAGGAVILAKTNMTEFAYSGVGANPHYGTPGNPADRARIPGGSSSGGAVAVADGLCEIAIGSDTGGSTRIPAALCGIVGYKPSRQRIPTDGVFPLSQSIDSVGPMAGSVADCAKADAVMADEDYAPLEPAPLAEFAHRRRAGHAAGTSGRHAWRKRFRRGLDLLAEGAGAKLSDEKLALLDDMTRIIDRGGVLPAEAFAVHRDRLDRRGDAIDPLVRARLESGTRHRRGRLHRDGERARDADPRHGCAALPTSTCWRCRPRRSSRRCSRRGRQRRRHSRRKQCAAAAQHRDLEFLRSAARSRCRSRARAACRPA